MKGTIMLRIPIIISLVALVGLGQAVEVRLQGISVDFPEPVRPFVQGDHQPISIGSGESLRLIWPAAEPDTFKATIDVAPMPPDLSLEGFWPEYLEGLTEEAGAGPINEAAWKRGRLTGNVATVKAQDATNAQVFTKVYMLSPKGQAAWMAVELHVADGVDQQAIERAIDLALTKARTLQQDKP